MAGKKSILVIDDIEDDLGSMVSLLEGQGYVVEGILNPKSALATIEKKKFDLVLIDVDMPGLNGIDLLKLIRKKYSKKMKLVFVSIILEADVDTKGADGFIQKPFSLETFLKKVKEVLK